MPMSVTYTNDYGRIVAENRAGTETLFLPDTLGNVIETRDMNTGAKTSETTYWPYGEIRTQTGTNPSPFGFCGIWGYYSSPNLPTYVRARYYRPAQGRWQTVDPLWPNELAYQYAQSTPVFIVDPSGLRPPWATTGPYCRQPRCSDLLTGHGVPTAVAEALIDLILKCKRKYPNQESKQIDCVADGVKRNALFKDIIENYLACMIASCAYTDNRCGDNICDYDLDAVACCGGHYQACMISCIKNRGRADVGFGISRCFQACRRKLEKCLSDGGIANGEDGENPWPY